MEIKENILLAPYTTFSIGGPARYFCCPGSVSELEEALVFASEKHLPTFVLGGGSNILVSDEGFDGAVIHLVNAAVDLSPTVENENNENVVVSVPAEMAWDKFVMYAVEHNFHGVERLSGIPGTVGGAVVANIGAYGRELSDVLTCVEVILRKGGHFTKKVFTNKECDFAYHDSMFSKERERHVITRAVFTLYKRALSCPEYRDNRFRVAGESKEGSPLALEDVRERILSIREQKGALAMPGRVGFLCAGSFFHMPFVSKEEYPHILLKAQVLDREKEERLRPWAWEETDGRYKLAPGFLLEYTQFQKGYCRGGVGVSPRHQLTIINLGNGTAREVAQLANDMAHAARELFGVTLEREVEYVGNFHE